MRLVSWSGRALKYSNVLNQKSRRTQNETTDRRRSHLTMWTNPLIYPLQVSRGYCIHGVMYALVH